MKSVTLTQPAPKTDAEYEAAFDLLLAEMQRMNEQMENNRVVIDEHKLKSDMLMAETRAILASMGAEIYQSEKLLALR